MPSPESQASFDDRLEHLVVHLEELRDLLCGRDAFWFSWIDRALHEIRQFDSRGLDHLLAAYGGMGSFNDLILGPTDGSSFKQAEIVLNERLGRLRTLCWAFANDLRQELRA